MAISKQQTVVIYPYAFGMGHLTPMLELAKLLATTTDFSILVVLLDTPDHSSANSSTISAVASSHPSISFHALPPPLSPPPSDLSPLVPVAQNHLLRLSNPLLSSFLTSASLPPPRALILDMFCTCAIDVARELGIPAFVFFPSNASALSAFALTPSVVSQTKAGLKELGDAPLLFPGLPPVPASHLPAHFQDRDSPMCKVRLYDFERLPTADGILVNTFEALERRAVKALTDGSCHPAGRPMPPVYCVGPLIAKGGGDRERHGCLTWLDAQPKESVVFLCFGSMGPIFSAEQLVEIAVGLERSGQRFLWVVRSPPPDTGKLFESGPERSIQELMPEGFLERTKDRGMVVKSWAPQAAVLAHESVGAFVTHCGWNSILEAVTQGVPMIAWPLYAEQRLNKVFLTEEARLAVEMKGYDKGMVSSEEVEAKIRWLMESEEGRELKDRAAAMKDSAVAARKVGGSSDKKWAEFVTALKEN